jgi:putative hydrolase of the HAD superfamily
MPLTTIFLDLDDTLYPATSGVWAAIRARIDLYMVERLHLPADAVPQIRQHLFRTYGTTMRGLQLTMQIDTRDYLDFVHDVKVHQYLKPDRKLRALLQKLHQRKIVFTNADANHATRVLRALGIEDCIDSIIDILAIAPYCKPDPRAFQSALHLSGEINASNCILVDDGLLNLESARKAGFYTIRVGSSERTSESHASIGRIHDLPDAISQIPISS